MPKSEAREEFIQGCLEEALAASQYWINGFRIVVDNETFRIHDGDEWYTLRRAKFVQAMNGFGKWVRDNVPSKTHYWREWEKCNKTNGEDGDYDATTLDAVLQFALFDDVPMG